MNYFHWPCRKKAILTCGLLIFWDGCQKSVTDKLKFWQENWLSFCCVIHQHRSFNNVLHFSLIYSSFLILIHLRSKYFSFLGFSIHIKCFFVFFIIPRLVKWPFLRQLHSVFILFLSLFLSLSPSLPQCPLYRVYIFSDFDEISFVRFCERPDSYLILITFMCDVTLFF